MSYPDPQPAAADGLHHRSLSRSGDVIHLQLRFEVWVRIKLKERRWRYCYTDGLKIHDFSVTVSTSASMIHMWSVQ